MWMIRLLQSLTVLLLKRGFHINAQLCTGFLRMPVGDMENLALV